MLGRVTPLLVGLTIMVSGLVVGAPAPAEASNHIYPMYFPLIGDNRYSDTFGACRSGCSRRHQGIDIIADKMIPIVAVADGTVGWMHDELGGRCCAMALYHDDGWESWYIHMNNDTPGTDDGQGWGFADGITSGVHVLAGQLIGWVGDSGNAENSVSHLHFELHDTSGTPVNPYESLLAAPVLTAPLEGAPPEPPCPEGADCDSVTFVDSAARFHVWSELAFGAVVSTFFYGNPGDVPLVGDWDCNGSRTPAMYRPTNGFMYLRNSNTQGNGEIEYFYGDLSDIPLAGDFNGDGCDTLAIYRPSEAKVYIKDSLGTGIADYSFFFGNPGDKPFVGDFDGDDIDTVGLHRESTGFVYFRNSNTQGNADFEFFYGDPGDRILAGDWNGDGVETVAVYRPSSGILYVKYSNTQGNADFQIFVGSQIAAFAAR